MFKRLLGLGIGVVSAVTAACDGAPMTQQVYIKDQGVLTYLRYAAAEGPMLVQVHGNPFVTSSGFLQQVVTQELEASITYIRGIRLTADPVQAIRPQYRIIVVMGADKAQDGNALCAGEAPRLDTTADPIRMVAVFCHKDEVLSEVRGSIAQSASPDDKTFRQWMKRIGVELLAPG